MTKRPQQLYFDGTEPVEPHPAIRTALDAWLAARDDAKDARVAVVNAHDVLLDAIQAAGLQYYSYDEDGRRKRVWPSAEPKLKTATVSTPTQSGRRGREKDVAMPIDKARAKAVDALHAIQQSGVTVSVVVPSGGGKRDQDVEHRRVSRREAVDDSDPFADVRKLVEEKQA